MFASLASLVQVANWLATPALSVTSYFIPVQSLRTKAGLPCVSPLHLLQPLASGNIQARGHCMPRCCPGGNDEADIDRSNAQGAEAEEAALRGYGQRGAGHGDSRKRERRQNLYIDHALPPQPLPHAQGAW